MKYIKKLNTNAQSLRYLDILAANIMRVNFYGILVFVPLPAAFVYNKILILEKRKDIEKKEKDLIMTIDLIRYLIKTLEGKKQLLEIYQNLSLPERNKIGTTAIKYNLPLADVVSRIS